MPKFLMHWLRLYTLRQRLRFLIVSIIVSMGVLMAGILYAAGYYNQQKDIHNQLQRTVSVQKIFIERWKEERSSDIRYFTERYRQSGLDLNMMTDAFNTFVGTQNEFSSLAFVNAGGRVTVDTSLSRLGEDEGATENFQAALKGRDYVSDLEMVKDSKMPAVFFSSPLQDAGGKFLGLIRGSVSLSVIDSLLGQYKLGKTGQIYMLSGNGLLLTANRYFPDSPRLSLTMETGIISQIRKDVHSAGPYIDFQGNEVFGDYAWTEDHRWILVGEISKDEVLKPLQRLLVYLVLNMLAVLLLGYLAMEWLMNKVERPLRHLLKGTRIMEKGNYDYTISQEAFRSAPTDLQQLCQSFNLASLKLGTTVRMLEQSAIMDQLTQVYNRRYLMNEGEAILKKWMSKGSPCSVLVIDADHFKGFNDAYGHLVGDRVLQHLASLLKKSVRSDDIVARFGGEEFVVLLPGLDVIEAARIGRELCRTVKSMPFLDVDTAYSCTVSIGAAGDRLSLDFGTTVLEDMIARADAALYEAKRAGRDCLKVWNEQKTKGVLNR